MMKNLSDLKDYLDDIIERLPSSIAMDYTLKPASLSDADFREIETELNIELPDEYKRTLSTYDMTNLRLGNIRYYAEPMEILNNHKNLLNPLHSIYEEKQLLEIGLYEADRILIALDDTLGKAGRIYYIDHAKLPKLGEEPVSKDFPTLVLCTGIDFYLKMESDYYMTQNAMNPEVMEVLFNEILSEIVKVDPIAIESSFWFKLIRGY